MIIPDLKLLALAAAGALVVALGVQTYRVRAIQADFDAFRLRVEAEGREARARAEAINAHQELVNEELENDIQKEREGRARERAARADRFDGLYRKYMGLLNADPGGGRVPEARPGAAEPVLGARECFDRERLAAGVRRDLGALHQELEQVARRGEDGLEASAFWGRWARLVGACHAAEAKE